MKYEEILKLVNTDEFEREFNLNIQSPFARDNNQAESYAYFCVESKDGKKMYEINANIVFDASLFKEFKGFDESITADKWNFEIVDSKELFTADEAIKKIREGETLVYWIDWPNIYSQAYYDDITEEYIITREMSMNGQKKIIENIKSLKWHIKDFD